MTRAAPSSVQDVGLAGEGGRMRRGQSANAFGLPTVMGGRQRCRFCERQVGVQLQTVGGFPKSGHSPGANEKMLANRLDVRSHWAHNRPR